jgi:Protein of unknown function (DUF3494)./Bacterial Ig-like domain (group 2).
MKKIILKSFVLMIAIFLSVLFVVPAMMYADVEPTPTFSPVAGAVALGTIVTITAIDANAIFYTTNGDDPTTSSTSVIGSTATVTINAAMTIKAYAARSGYDPSAIGSAAYTIAAAPILVTSIVVTGAAAETTVPNGGTLTMQAAVLPADATDSSVVWSVAPGTGTATIDSGTGVLSGTGDGTVTVTATAHDGSTVTGTEVITVVAATPIPEKQPTVPLGKTSKFAVLAYSKITDAGAASTVTGANGGDVGLSPTTGAAITGLTKAHVSGKMYVVDDVNPDYTIDPGLLTQAKNDLDTAYTNAANRTPTTTFTEADNPLGGKTLTTGVYKFNSRTTDLVGTLTLDAQGDENAVFIFQATSTLITASASRIELINSARFCRVFWVVPSSATLGSGSIFVGHIFAYASISVTSGTTVFGQLLARTGAVTLINDTITNGPCGTTASAAAEETVAPVETVAPAVTAAAASEETTVETTPVTTTVTGGQIPKTSTPWYNILITGAALILIGAMGWWITRKINGKNET